MSGKIIVCLVGCGYIRTLHATNLTTNELQYARKAVKYVKSRLDGNGGSNESVLVGTKAWVAVYTAHEDAM